jgi:NADH-quinone oxidoreductase subunit J
MVPVAFTALESIAFWVAAVVAVIGGIGVIVSRTAIYSALSLIVTLSQLAVLYLLLNAQFLAVAQILIYAGAIMVLFLFVITLLGVREYPFVAERLPLQQPLSIVFGGGLLLGIIFFVAQSARATITGAHGTFNSQLSQGNVQAFGKQLFTTFVLPFEVTPLLLIVAMIGAVALGKRRPRPIDSAPTQEESPSTVITPETEREPEAVDV